MTSPCLAPLFAEGSGFFSSGVNVTGTLSGTTITGTAAQFTNVTGVNIIGTTQVSGATVTGGLGTFTTLPALMVRLQLKFLARRLQVYPVSLLQLLPLLALVPNSLLVTI